MNPRFILVFCFLLPGAVQGLVLYLLTERLTSDDIQAAILAAYLFIVLAPIVHHLSTEPGKRLSAFAISGFIGGLCALLAFWSSLRFSSDLSESEGLSELFSIIIICSFLITLISLPFLRTVFIGRRSMFNYSVLLTYAWSQCVCVFIALLFTLLTTLIMMLSVALFDVLGVDLGEFVYRQIVILPVLGAAFGLAIGIARQSESIIYNTCHVLLALLRALLPVFMVITGGFLITTLVAGIGNLDTGFSVTLLLITSMTVSILLCNGAVQDNADSLQGMMSWMVRVQAVILPGFSALAFYGLWMRMSEYGLTHGRLIAVIITAIASLYAVGYLLSALSRSLVKNIQRVNITVALVTLTVAIALLTPVLDVHSLAVRSQVNALAKGDTTADKFDFRYLKFKSGHAGKDAFEQLKTMDVADRAGLDVALKSAEKLPEYEYYQTADTSALEEFNQWLESGKIELYRPTQDPDFELLVTESRFIDALRFSCIDAVFRCVIMQTTQFNAPGIQYILATATSGLSVHIQLYYRDDQGVWTSAVESDTYWYSGKHSGTLMLPAEEITQVMDQLATGNMAMEPITFQGIRIGDDIYIPGMGTGLDVLRFQ
jgi:hypothetical protein